MPTSKLQNERPYINEHHPMLRKISIGNWNNMNILWNVHFELQFRTRKSPIINLICRIEERLKEIVYSYWHCSESLQELQDELFFENTKFANELKQEIEERIKALESFRWVSTKAQIGFSNLDTSNWKKDNLLSLLGYKSGNYGIDDESRIGILDYVYTQSIPKNVLPFIEDINEWGKPNSGIRLKKMVDSIASVVRNEKRNITKDYRLSILERESDLDYLKKTYYDGVYDFQYPKT